jgi:hypothetical protein
MTNAMVPGRIRQCCGCGFIGCDEDGAFERDPREHREQINPSGRAAPICRSSR